MIILFETLAISLVINTIFFAIAYRLQTDKFTDTTYSLSFALIALFMYGHSDKGLYEAIGGALVLVWATRIGAFLLYRVMRNGRDKRFDGTREKFRKFARFWFNQALVAWILMIPAALAFSGSARFSSLSLIGGTIWLLGLVIEAIADLQKFRFRLNPKNKNKWIESGIWHYSRHPNYFGEMLIWAGIYLYAVPALSMTGKFVGLISPVAIILLLRYGSGVPILEKAADKRWGDDAAYLSYKQKTNLIVPFFR